MRKEPNNRFSKRYPLLHRVTLPYSRLTKENDQRACMVQFNRVDALLREATDLLPLASMYLNSRQHDAGIISVERTSRDFTIWMEDFQVLCLSQVLDAMAGTHIRYSRARYPVGFKFCDVYSLSVSRVNDNDKILPVSIPRDLPSLDEFHYDEVTEISPDFLSMGILLATRRTRGSSARLVEVQCRKLEFIEAQRAPFESLFGDRYPGLYDAFYLARREKLQYFDYSDAREFVLQEVGGEPRE